MHVDAVTAKRIEKSLRSLPDEELTKWRNETAYQYLKNAIDNELEKRFWNGKSEIEPHTFDNSAR